MRAEIIPKIRFGSIIGPSATKWSGVRNPTSGTQFNSPKRPNRAGIPSPGGSVRNRFKEGPNGKLTCPSAKFTFLTVCNPGKSEHVAENFFDSGHPGWNRRDCRQPAQGQTAYRSDH